MFKNKAFAREALVCHIFHGTQWYFPECFVNDPLFNFNEVFSLCLAKFSLFRLTQTLNKITELKLATDDKYRKRQNNSVLLIKKRFFNILWQHSQVYTNKSEVDENTFALYFYTFSSSTKEAS